MSTHAIFLGRPDVLLKARVANLHLAEKWSLTVERVTAVRMRMPAAAAQRPWMTETEVKAKRVRNLMNDNPTSG